MLLLVKICILSSIYVLTLLPVVETASFLHTAEHVTLYVLVDHELTILSQRCGMDTVTSFVPYSYQTCVYSMNDVVGCCYLHVQPLCQVPRSVVATAAAADPS